jgi:hypothetical protein
MLRIGKEIIVDRPELGGAWFITSILLAKGNM